MAISAQCSACGLRYSAPDSLAGKSVRCKRCGTIFIVTDTPAQELLEAGTDSVVQAAGARQEEGEAQAVAIPPPPPYPPLSDPDDIDAVLRGGGVQEMSQADVIRSTQPFDYPYSRHVDKWLPPLMLLVAGLIVVAKTLVQDDQGRVWIPAVRVLMIVVLYGLVVFPLSHLGVKHGVRKLAGHMPWSAPWKSFASFSIPYALGYLLWLTGRSVSSLLLGCAVGLVVAVAALWLLYRLRLERGLEPMIYGVLAFIVGTSLTAAFIVGLNLTALAITQGSATMDAFEDSPVLPGLPWGKQQSQLDPALPATQHAREGLIVFGAPPEARDGWSGEAATTLSALKLDLTPADSTMG